MVRGALALWLIACPLSAHAQAIAAAPLPARTLDGLRGGFDLPSGVTIGLGVVTETRVNGQEILRTVFNVQTGPPTLSVLARAAGTADQLTSVNAAAGGPAVATADGNVTVVQQSRGVGVSIAGDRIDVTHLIGSSIGSIVANSADNRVIDVATTVNISLGGIARDAIGASGARVDTLALDATARLSR